MPMTKQEFGKWLSDRLRHEGLDQKNLARQCGVSGSTITRWKNGEVIIDPDSRIRLAQALGLRLDEMPEVLGARELASGVPLPAIGPTLNATSVELHVVRDGVPDHSLIELAVELGCFANQGIAVKVVDNSTRLRFPHLQNEILDTEYERKLLLFSSPKGVLNLEDRQYVPLKTTNIYRAYAMITLRDKLLAQMIDQVNPTQFVYLMRQMADRGMLDRLESLAIGSTASRGKQPEVPHFCEPRIGWQGPDECRFLCGIYLMYSEIARQAICGRDVLDAISERGFENRMSPESDFSVSHDALLGQLDESGSFGRDVIVGDAFDLAVAFSRTKKYKVLLSLRDIKSHVLNEKTLDRYLETCKAIEAIYPEGKDSSVKMFLKKWNDFFGKLESRVNWLVIGKEADKCRGDVERRLNNVIDMVVQYVTAPRTARDAKQRLWQIVNRSRTGVEAPELEAFEKAWEESYVMCETPATSPQAL